MYPACKLERSLDNPETRKQLDAILGDNVTDMLSGFARDILDKRRYPVYCDGAGGSWEWYKMKEVFEAIDDYDVDRVRWAFESGHIGKHGVNTFHEDETALYRAVHKRKLWIVEYLLQQPGIDVNVREYRHHDEQDTVLHAAVGNPSILALLLQHEDLNVNVHNAYAGETPLLMASRECREMLLADRRTDVNLSDSYGNTLLHYIITDDDQEFLRTVLKHPKIDVNALDEKGQSPAFHGIRSYIPWTLDTFLSDERVLLSLRDCEGKTIKDLLDPDHPFSTLDHSQWYFPRLEDPFSLIRRHELIRLERAKKQMKVVQDKLNIEDEVLRVHLLPFLADIISPIDELEASQ